MPDPRFFELGPPIAIRELAALAGAQDPGPEVADRLISGVGSLETAGPDEVTFHFGRQHLAALERTSAAACFVGSAQVQHVPAATVPLQTAFPQNAFARAAERLYSVRRCEAGSSSVHPSSRIEDGAVVEPGAVIGADAEIGSGTVIGAGAVIGPGVTIGRDCRIGPRVVVMCALVGDRVRLQAGAVIGEAGFGAAAGPNGVIDLPQLGRVILQDGVSVGANSCIDRGALEDTVIGENTKIDNLVQIAHNVCIGRNCVLAAHTGISGSCTIGDGCMFGGRVGLADHLTIGNGVRLAAASGVMHSIADGETWGGYPARPVSQWMREVATLSKLTRSHGEAKRRT